VDAELETEHQAHNLEEKAVETADLTAEPVNLELQTLEAVAAVQEEQMYQVAADQEL
jgi:hypothetical protein